jgi:serine protease Do
VFGLPSPDGAVVASQPGGGAAAAGLQLGDVIVAVDGQAVRNTGDLMETILRKEPGETVKVEYVRYGSRRSATLRLGQMDGARAATLRQPGAQDDAADDGAAGKVGFAATQLTPDLAAQAEMKVSQGVVVTSVNPAGPAAGQLFPGFVIDRFNGRPISTVADLRSAIAAVRPGQVVSLVGRRPDGSQTIVNFRAAS